MKNRAAVWYSAALTPVLLILVSTLVVVSCGGGSSPPPNPIQGVSPGGIWRGTDSASGLTIVALIDEAGDGDFMRADNAVFIGQVSTSGNSISAAVDGYVGNTPFPDGSTHGTWTIDGTIQERQSISATTTFTTDAGTVTQGTLDLTFDTLYDRPSSLAMVAGSFTDNGFSVVVSPDGSFGEYVLLCGGIDGHISVIDGTHNVYRVKSGNACGVSSGGLAMLDNTLSPERLLIGLAVSSGGLTEGVVSTWFRQN